jgi:hypothetical protein
VQVKYMGLANRSTMGSEVQTTPRLWPEQLEGLNPGEHRWEGGRRRVYRGR